MRKLRIVIIALLLLHNLQAQLVPGKYNVGPLIGDYYPTEEYNLNPANPDSNTRGGGYNCEFKADGTFYNRRIPGCGQDRFPPHFSGTYKVIDENYISFFVERGFREKDTLICKDFGTFYYYKKGDGFHLILTSGNLERDKQIVFYRELLLAKGKEVIQYENVLEWKQVKLKDEKEIVSFCLAENQIIDFKILYSQLIENDWKRIFLIKTGNNFRYVIYDKDRDCVALYDDSQINTINSYISEIESDNKLKTKILKETFIQDRTSSDKNTIIVYSKKKTIYKAVYNQYFVQGGGWFTTIYFQNGEPVYVDFEEKSIYHQQESSSKVGCYLLDLKKNRIVTKMIKHETGDLHFPSDFLDRALEDIKKQYK